MENIKITTQESEAVERAYYEAQSYEALMAILSRQLNAGANSSSFTLSSGSFSAKKLSAPSYKLLEIYF